MSSDHESVTLEEADGQTPGRHDADAAGRLSEKNLLDLLPLVTDTTWPRITFASDDRDCHDLITQGHMDDILRIAIDAGLDPVRAITMATWNPARHWRLRRTRCGCIRLPGKPRRAVGPRNGRRPPHDPQWPDRGDQRLDASSVRRSEPAPGKPRSYRQHRAGPRVASRAPGGRSANRAVEVIPGQIVTGWWNSMPTPTSRAGRLRLDVTC